jgi:hypothetical protein
MITEGDGIDLLFRNEKQHLMPPFVKRLGYGKPWKKVPSSASTGDDKVLGC